MGFKCESPAPVGPYRTCCTWQAGAALEGGFSRADYDLLGAHGNSFRTFPIARLPLCAISALEVQCQNSDLTPFPLVVLQ